MATTSTDKILVNWGVVDYLAAMYAADGPEHSVKQIASHAVGVPSLYPVYRVAPSSAIDPTDGWMPFGRDAVGLYEAIRRIALTGRCGVPESPPPPTPDKPKCPSCRPICPPPVGAAPGEILAPALSLPPHIAALPLFRPDPTDGFGGLEQLLAKLARFHGELHSAVWLIGAVLAGLQGKPEVGTPSLPVKLSADWLGEASGSIRDLRRERLAQAVVQAADALCGADAFMEGSCKRGLDESLPLGRRGGLSRLGHRQREGDPRWTLSV